MESGTRSVPIAGDRAGPRPEWSVPNWVSRKTQVCTKTFPIFSFHIMCSLVTNYFGTDQAQIFPLDVQCNGSEAALDMCNFTIINMLQCQKLAGVICDGLNNTLYLANMSYIYFFFHSSVSIAKHLMY